MGEVVKRTKSAAEALQSLMRLCSRAERSSGDALRLMHRWGVSDVDACKVLAQLQRERFIDDRRFAELYAREKLNLSGWGAYKIEVKSRCHCAKRVYRRILLPRLCDQCSGRPIWRVASWSC